MSKHAVKAKGRHPHNALTSLFVRRITEPGWHADGNTLFLEVDENGKRWAQRLVIHGKRTDLGLGGLEWVSLAEARELAARNRKIARSGGDPLAERRRQSETPTFEKAARTVHEERAKDYGNAKHRAQWIATLETYAFPIIGKMRVNVIDTPDVLRVLAPIWTSIPETARRVKQRMNTVFDWAKAAGHRTGDNPVSGVMHGLKKHDKNGAGHHAALKFQRTGEFMEALRSQEGTAARALEFAILTVTRTGEVIGAKSDEIDQKAATWTIPPERMKAKREHRVPLAPRALEIIKAQPADGFLFQGAKEGQPLSNMAMLELLKRMGRDDITVHGFRSTFRDWAAETTAYAHELQEMALAHTIKNKAEAAYRRGDLFEKRRRLMLDWAKFCERPAKPASVTPLRKSTAA